jgi:hypothetical protein
MFSYQLVPIEFSRFPESEDHRETAHDVIIFHDAIDVISFQS